MRTDVLGLARSLIKGLTFIVIYLFNAISIQFSNKSHEISDNDVPSQIYYTRSFVDSYSSERSSKYKLPLYKKSIVESALFHTKSWQTYLIFDTGEKIPDIWRWLA